jgi:ribosomal protein S18 acetylase RimI-like enzyme
MDDPEQTGLTTMVRLAGPADLDLIVPLFDVYRVFYRRTSDIEAARRFLRERFEREESVILLAFRDSIAVGFIQLYPMFSSAAMARSFVLNDLFVAPDARRLGVGEALLEAAAEYGRSVGAFRLTLSTELTNEAAQALYEKAGWIRDQVFCVYHSRL